jgi:hypothetical protein
MVNRIIVTLFVLTLLSPWALMWTGLDYDVEFYQDLKPPAAITAGTAFDRDYYLGLEKYFSRKFPLVGFFITTKHYIDYKVFNTSPSDRVYIGQDGWMYYKFTLDSYDKMDCDKSAEVELLHLRLHMLQRMVEASGRKFFFMVAPNKSTIYPEHVGYTPAYKDLGRCGKSFYDLLVERNAAYPIEGFIYVDNALRELKRSRKVYFKTDSHWTEPAGAVVGDLIVGEVFGNGAPPSHKEYSENSKPQHMMKYVLGLEVPEDFTEVSVSGMPLVTTHERISPPEGAKVVRAKAVGGRDIERYPSMVAYVDSFSQSYFNYIRGYFRAADLLWDYHVPLVKQWENLNDYDVIGIEVVERNLRVLDIDNQRIGNELDFDGPAFRAIPYDFASAGPVSGASVMAAANALFVNKLDADNKFVVGALPSSDRLKFRMLRVTIESKSPEALTMTWPSAISGDYVQVSRAFGSGVTEAYLPVPFELDEAPVFSLSGQSAFVILHGAEILE